MNKTSRVLSFQYLLKSLHNKNTLFHQDPKRLNGVVHTLYTAHAQTASPSGRALVAFEVDEEQSNGLYIRQGECKPNL